MPYRSRTDALMAREAGGTQLIQSSRGRQGQAPAALVTLQVNTGRQQQAKQPAYMYTYSSQSPHRHRMTECTGSDLTLFGTVFKKALFQSFSVRITVCTYSLPCLCSTHTGQGSIEPPLPSSLIDPGLHAGPFSHCPSIAEVRAKYQIEVKDYI